MLTYTHSSAPVAITHINTLFSNLLEGNVTGRKSDFMKLFSFPHIFADSPSRLPQELAFHLSWPLNPFSKKFVLKGFFRVIHK
jgi:hypothetical protein